MGESEVAQLRQKIVEEYEAMKRGLSGFAWGSARHAIIDARMRRIDSYHQQLAQHIGEEPAALLVCEIYEQVIS